MHPHRHHSSFEANKPFFLGEERWNLWLHKRSVTRDAVDITDSWEQLPLSLSRGEKCCSSPHYCIYVNWRIEGLPPSSVLRWGRLRKRKEQKRLFFCHIGNERKACSSIVYVLLIGFPYEHFAFVLLPLNSPLFEKMLFKLCFQIQTFWPQ